MEAATLEESSGDTRPVFVTGRRHRSHAVRLAAAALGLLLAGWLAALVAGLVGFSPLPELTIPGAGGARAPAVAPEQGSSPAAKRDAGAHASPAATGSKGSGSQATAAQSSPPSASGSGAQDAGQAAGEGAGSAPPASGSGATQAPASPGTGASPASSGDGPPSFTPPASGEKNASPPRGNSANAPGQTVAADPPGKATRPNSG